MCRVVKRNEQGTKMGDFHGESKGKRCLPIDGSDLVPRKNFNKGLSSSEEDSSRARSIFEIGNDSSPITSLESEKGTEVLPAMVGSGLAGFWESQYLYDAPKVSHSC